MTEHEGILDRLTERSLEVGVEEMGTIQVPSL
jgi:hypothetical protein